LLIKIYGRSFDLRKALLVLFTSVLFILMILAGAAISLLFLTWASTLFYAVSLLYKSEFWEKLAEHIAVLIGALIFLFYGPIFLITSLAGRGSPLTPIQFLPLVLLLEAILMPIFNLLPSFIILNIASKVKYVRGHMSALMYLLAFLLPIVLFCLLIYDSIICYEMHAA